jgi:hypothetical protein
VVAAGAVLADGAIAFVEAAGIAACDEAAGAAAVEAAGAAGVAAFSLLLQAARAQAKATAERTMRYFFMFVHHQDVQGKRKCMILLDDFKSNRAIGREF